MGKGHARNEDTYLNKDGVNETNVVDIKDSVTKKHSQNTDTIVKTLGAINPVITDELLRTITNVGAVVPDALNYRVGNGSMLFSGSNYLTTPCTGDLVWTTNNFTVDFWVSFNNLPSVAQIFYFVSPDQFSRLSCSILAAGGGPMLLCISAGIYGNFLTTPSITINTSQWYHIAFVRSGNNWYIFLDGVLQTSGVADISLVDFSTSTVFIGAQYPGGGGALPLDGRLDEFRVSNSARWTSGFTPSTTPHEVDANTVLLIHSDDPNPEIIDLINYGTLKNDLEVLDGKKVDGRDISIDGAKLDTLQALSVSPVEGDLIVYNNGLWVRKPIGSVGQRLEVVEGTLYDSYTNLLMHMDEVPFVDAIGHTITNVGTVALDTDDKKFGAGSAQLSGSNYFTTPCTGTLIWGNNYWTVDFWVQFDNFTPDAQIFYFVSPDQYQRLSLGIINGGSGQDFFIKKSSGDIVTSVDQTLSTGVWYHVAFVRYGNVFTIYLNGTAIASATEAYSFYDFSTSTVFIGAQYPGGGGAFPLNGKLDEFRVSSTARWITDFTPPTDAYQALPTVDWVS